MRPVTPVIRGILRDKRKGLITGAEMVRELLEQLRGQVVSEISTAAVDSWQSYHLPKLLRTIESQIGNFDAKINAEASGLLTESWGMGQSLIDMPLQVSGLYYGLPGISTSVLDTLREFTFGKMSGVSQSAFERIKAELTMGILGGKTPADVIKAVGKNLKAPSIFKSIALRAETIVQTEMGRAFSMAADMRVQQAAQYVPDMGKQWVHAGHPKTARPGHVAAHGKHVPANEPFKIWSPGSGFINMMHPRDPGAPIEEIIHCGCDSIPYREEWGMELEELAA